MTARKALPIAARLSVATLLAAYTVWFWCWVFGLVEKAL